MMEEEQEGATEFVCLHLNARVLCTCGGLFVFVHRFGTVFVSFCYMLLLMLCSFFFPLFSFSCCYYIHCDIGVN